LRGDRVGVVVAHLGAENHDPLGEQALVDGVVEAGSGGSGRHAASVRGRGRALAGSPPRADNPQVTQAPVPASPGRRTQAQIYRDGALGRRPAVPTSPAGLERAARRAMSRRAWGYVAGSAGAEATAAANRAALDGVRLVPRMLRDVSRRDLGVEFLGRARATPLVLCPLGVMELVHPDADLAVARAAGGTGVPMVVSSQASRPMEEIAAAIGDGEWWFQLYWSSHEELAASFVRRAEAAGAAAVVVTVDTHTLGWRPRDLDLGFLPFARGQGIAQYTHDPVFRELVRERAARPAAGPRPRPTPAALRTLLSITRHVPADGPLAARLRSPYARAAVETFLEVFSRPTLTWPELARLRERTTLPVIVKGVQSADDARLAVDHGIDGIMVSNHGGRQVDGAIGSLDALPGVVEAVAGRVPVLFDSGIRSGADVLKALALGATAVGIGRPWAYGLAIAGEAGARQVIEHLVAEVDLSLGLIGEASVRGLGPHVVSLS
jgi:isopentenyl diphosphate isomerase/L-lactate dehydrogenase-like FMN-dependent dehydrogenase